MKSRHKACLGRSGRRDCGVFGVERDIDSLVENNVHLVRQVARARFASRLPDDDMEQCGLIGLWEAAQKWSGTVDFPPFARVCIFHNMLDYVRGMSAKKRQPFEELDETEETEDITADLDTVELCAEFGRVLLEHTLEYTVLTQIALNGDIHAVADQLGLEVSEVRSIAKRAYRAVKRAREEE